MAKEFVIKGEKVVLNPDFNRLVMSDLLSIDEIAKQLFSSQSRTETETALSTQFMDSSHCIALAWVACLKSDTSLARFSIDDLPLPVAYWLNSEGFSFRAGCV